jgi:hypothetical protein
MQQQTFHPTRRALLGARDLKTHLRHRFHPFSFRQLSLPFVETPEMRGSEEFGGGDEKDIESPVLPSFSLFLGQHCGKSKDFVRIGRNKDHLPRLDVGFEIRLPRNPLNDRDSSTKHQMAHCICKLEADERMRSIRSPHLLEQFVQILPRENRFALATAKRRALAPVHRLFWNLRRRFPTFHHHILTLLDPSDNGVQIGPEILKRGRFYSHRFPSRPRPVKI